MVSYKGLRFSLLYFQLFNFVVLGIECRNSLSPYSIVIDGGSTGSRLHIFEFVEVDVANSTSDDDLLLGPTSTDKAHTTDTDATKGSTTCICERRGSQKVGVPLSSFGDAGSPCNVGTTSLSLNSSCVAEHLLEVFDYAAKIIPSQYHAATSVAYQATAGMRLLSAQDQEAVYDAIYEGLMQSTQFVFRSLDRSHIATLSGELEGYYGAVAANYLKGTIDVELTIIEEDHDKDQPVVGNGDDTDVQPVVSLGHSEDSLGRVPFVGALDMGGSSTQIVYFHSANGRQSHRSNEYSTCQLTGYNERTNTTLESPTSVKKMNGDDFFSTSYLSYGVEQLRERLWTTWVNERKRQNKQQSTAEDTCATEWINNPCSFRGHKAEWMGHTLIGSGDVSECAQQIKRLIPHPEELHDFHLTTDTAHAENNDDNEGEEVRPFNVVGGVEHPPITQGNKFYAMSQYFYTFDSLRLLSGGEGEMQFEAQQTVEAAWPTPSIQELYNALDGLCSRMWFGDLHEIRHTAHKYTGPDLLQHRCFEAVYLVTLLKDGFGFDTSSRDIMFAYDVEGSEVEWSLGLALVDYADEGGNNVCDAALNQEDKEEMLGSKTGKDGVFVSTGGGSGSSSAEGSIQGKTTSDVVRSSSSDGSNITEDDDDVDGDVDEPSASLWTRISSHLTVGSSYVKDQMVVKV